MNQREHGQVPGFKFAGRINQHAFDCGPVVGFPPVGLALRKITLGEEMVEGGDGLRLIELGGAVGKIDFGGLAER